MKFKLIFLSLINILIVSNFKQTFASEANVKAENILISSFVGRWDKRFHTNYKNNRNLLTGYYRNKNCSFVDKGTYYEAEFVLTHNKTVKQIENEFLAIGVQIQVNPKVSMLLDEPTSTSSSSLSSSTTFKSDKVNKIKFYITFSSMAELGKFTEKFNKIKSDGNLAQITKGIKFIYSENDRRIYGLYLIYQPGDNVKDIQLALIQIFQPYFSAFDEIDLQSKIRNNIYFTHMYLTKKVKSQKVK